MKNNTAVLNCKTKRIKFMIDNELFDVDLTEGDLEDSWNSIKMKNGDLFDFNFCWEDTTYPALSLYEIKKYADGTLYTDFHSNTKSPSIVTIIGDKNDYLDVDEYVFDSSNILFVKVLHNNKELLSTSSINEASDFSGALEFQGKKCAIVATDINGVTKTI